MASNGVTDEKNDEVVVDNHSYRNISLYSGRGCRKVHRSAPAYIIYIRTRVRASRVNIYFVKL